jgi:tyrosinase
MTISRRRLLKRATLLASSAALPSWLSDSLLAQAAQPLIRYSVSSTDTEGAQAVAAYRSAVAAMKNRNASQPTSWQFQANIHCWPGQFGATAANPEKEFQDVFAADNTHEPLARKIWGTCTHGEPTVSFLPWHRIYLYFFERIMRAAAGQPPSSRLGLPYWDWTKERTLPLAFREEVNGSQKNNPLYWDIRRASVTRVANPTPLPAGVASAGVISTLLGNPAFSIRLDPSAPVDFSDGLESGPHGQVHTFVGVSPRGMGFFEEAGRDPCFWVHHCNIDRLWNHWRQKTGHTNPINAGVPINVPNNQRKPWSQLQHTFVDENGQEVKLSTGQVLAAVEILDRGYVYDDLQPAIVTSSNAPPPAPASAPQGAAGATAPARRIRTLASAGPLEVSGGSAAITLQGLSAAAAPAPGGIPEPPVQDRVLVLKDVAAPAGAGGLYGVYVNVPPDVQPTPDSAYFVGTVDTFNAAAAGRQMTVPAGSAREESGTAHAQHGGIQQRLSLTEALKRQQWKEGDPVRVTVAPIGLDNQLAAPGPANQAAAAPVPGPELKIGGIDVIGY